jgi:hypothetical protein
VAAAGKTLNRRDRKSFADSANENARQRLGERRKDNKATKLGHEEDLPRWNAGFSVECEFC